MRLDVAFRLSSYLTLGLACLCLAVAEQYFLPGIYLFLLTILVLLALAWFIEGRWALPISASNLLGAVIGLGAFAWIGHRSYVASQEMLQGVTFPAAMLPFLGPLLMVLLLVKLLRPKKAGDHWSLQGIGLGHVALGCVLASEPLFGLLLLAYFFSAVWHILVFHYYRQARLAGELRKIPPGAGDSPPPSAPSLVRALGWSAGILIVGMPLYLVLPRTGQFSWNPVSLAGTIVAPRTAESKVGYSNDMDLNPSGALELDDEIAFSVYAEDAQGRPILDLSPEQRWRGNVLDHYEDGKWINNSTTFRIMPRIPRKPLENKPGHKGSAPALLATLYPISIRDMTVQGSKQSTVDFNLKPARVGGLFLADQAKSIKRASLFVPSQFAKPSSRELPVFIEFQNILAIGPLPDRIDVRYRQVIDSSAESTGGWPENPRWAPTHEFLCDYPDALHQELLGYTQSVLQKLKSDKRYDLKESDLLTIAVRHRPGVTTVSQSEKVARALCEYLSSSGEFTYSLDRPRINLEMDPTLDFLKNAKQGHCERFAGALTLMLRSLEIPARIVKGFRGAESHGTGKYDIRQSFAHAWVEVLIAQPSPDGSFSYRWMPLDPTPSTGETMRSSSSLTRWFKDKNLTPQAFWRDLIINYRADQQQSVLTSFWKSLIESTTEAQDSKSNLSGKAIAVVVLGGGIGILVLAGGATGAVRFLRGRKRSTDDQSKTRLAPYYARLLRAMAAHAGMHPADAQTPLEFAHKASRHLVLDQRTQSQAAVPTHIVNMYYRDRYGGKSLSNTEMTYVESQLSKLEMALAK
jgi:protein-glutamine gamma-glutamyltransferase